VLYGCVLIILSKNTCKFDIVQQDSELINRLQNKEQQALSQTYDQYGAAIYGVILRICKDETQAQDLLQEVFLKVWDKIDLYNPDKGKLFT